MVNTSKPTNAARVLALTHFCGVTPRLFAALLQRFETLDAIYRANREAFLGIEGVTVDTAARLEKVSEQLKPASEMARRLLDREIELVTRFDDTYSPLLFELNDPPSLMYVRGKMPGIALKSVAIVGAREATSEGIGLTSRIVKEFVQNEVQVVSSLVGGIDMAAHLAARSAGGVSFAVLEHGSDHVDQQEAMPVAIDIIQTGGVISEYAPEVEAHEMFIPQANRLVVGLAQAVVITELYDSSTRSLDLLRTCRDVGKLTFFMVDPELGALADETSLGLVAECGAIPIEGFDRVGDIIKSLV
jgi:DNA processing protein